MILLQKNGELAIGCFKLEASSYLGLLNGSQFAERCGGEVEEDPEAGACRKSGQDRDASRQADADREPQDRDDVTRDEQAVALFVVLDVVARVVNVRYGIAVWYRSGGPQNNLIPF